MFTPHINNVVWCDLSIPKAWGKSILNVKVDTETSWRSDIPSLPFLSLEGRLTRKLDGWFGLPPLKTNSSIYAVLEWFETFDFLDFQRPKIQQYPLTPIRICYCRWMVVCAGGEWNIVFFLLLSKKCVFCGVGHIPKVNEIMQGFDLPETSFGPPLLLFRNTPSPPSQWGWGNSYSQQRQNAFRCSLVGTERKNGNNQKNQISWNVAT